MGSSALSLTPRRRLAGAITLEFDEVYLLATYVPNSGDRFKKLDRRKDWNVDFEPHIRSLDKVKPVIWTGPSRRSLLTSTIFTQ